MSAECLPGHALDGLPGSPAPSLAKRIAGFLVLFALYQSAEGIGGRWLHSFAVQAGLMALALLATWPVARWLGWPGWRAYALEPRRAAWGWLAASLLLAAGLKLAAVRLGLALGIYVPAAGAIPASAVLAGLPMLLVSTFVPSVTEDILTRGYPLRAAGIAWRHGPAFVLASTALYVANHVYRLHLGPREWALLASYGLVYATAAWRTGSLWPAVGLHWGWNLGNGLADGVLPADTADAAGGATLSVAMHAAMLLAVLALSRRR